MTTTNTIRRKLTMAAVAVLLAHVAARAADPVGRVAALEGRAEVQHAGAAAWTSLAAGDGVVLGDKVRTLADSRLKLLFRDDSVLSLAAGSELEVNEQVAGAAAPVSRFSVLAGSVRALVTERYGAPGARFEVETPTAVAGVRGTSFITAYDAANDETVVLGLLDTTRVRSQTDPRGAREVQLGPGQATTVRRGAFPTDVRRMPEDQVRSLTAATALHGEQGAKGGAENPAEPRLPSRPGERTGSPENRVIDQPVDVLKKTPPGGIGPPPPPVPGPRR
jgi:hypothetical protein